MKPEKAYIFYPGETYLTVFWPKERVENGLNSELDWIFSQEFLIRGFLFPESGEGTILLLVFHGTGSKVCGGVDVKNAPVWSQVISRQLKILVLAFSYVDNPDQMISSF